MGRRKLWERITDALDLETVSMTKVPLVELYGGKRVLIENHFGVLEYTENQICVRVKCGMICVSGQSLTIALMSRERVVICGSIESVHMKEVDR